MSRRDEPAFPVVAMYDPEAGGSVQVDLGLTKFEHTVIEMAKGILSGRPIERTPLDPESVSEFAYTFAAVVWDRLDRCGE